MEPSDINERTQIVGRQIWRVVPYAKRYPGRVLSGIFGNAMARFFDLMPFVAIGLAVDYSVLCIAWVVWPVDAIELAVPH